MKRSSTAKYLSLLLAAIFLCAFPGCKNAQHTDSADSSAVSSVKPVSASSPTAVLIDLSPKSTEEPVSERSAGRIVYDLAVTYAEDASPERIRDLLNELHSIDAELSGRWEEVLNYTDSCLQDMTINRDILPDGLNDTDTLCIIVLGYQLNKNGSIAKELSGRLDVALKSAEKYPNSMILCAGGATSSEKKDRTEADSMAAWLVEHGISKDRIIIENKSRSTVDNAKYTFRILTRQYPSIREAAVITSDYHIPRSSVFLAAKFLLSGGPDPIRIVSNAAYQTDKSEELTKRQLIKGILKALDDPEIDAILDTEGFPKTEPASD